MCAARMAPSARLAHGFRRWRLSSALRIGLDYSLRRKWGSALDKLRMAAVWRWAQHGEGDCLVIRAGFLAP